MHGTGHTIGIDVGGTKTLGVVVADSVASGAAAGSAPGSVTTIVADSEQVPSDAHRAESVDAIVAVARSLIERVDAEVTAIGVGLAGFVDSAGVVRSAPNSSGLVDQDVIGRLRREFGVPAVADNDANCVAVAAHAILAPDARDLVAVTLGTGIGGGLIVGGELVRGAHGFAGEPGHMVVDPSGPPCPCGQRGCWERYASGSGLAMLARAAVERGDAAGLAAAVGGDAAQLRGEHVTDLLAAGDPGARSVFDEYSAWVALGVANLINVLDPGVVVLGGGVAGTGDELVGRVRDVVASRFPAASDHRNASILAAPFGPQAGAVGAALLAGTLRR